ncbi:MAG: hypothetical protein RSB67_03085 [Clostridia bacterium]
MNDLFSNCDLSEIIKKYKVGNLDINKLIIIILLATDKLNIEAIHVYKNNFIVSLGTFIDD